MIRGRAARFLAEVDHPNIVKVYNFVEHDGEPLHRHGVRPGRDAPHDARAAEGREQRRTRPAAAESGRSQYHARGAARVRVPPPPGSALLRLQARQRDPHRFVAEAHRPGRGVPAWTTRPAPSTARRDIRRPRSPTPGPTIPSDLYTVGRTLAVSVHATARLPDARSPSRSPPPTRCPCSRSTTRSTASSCGRPRPIPTTGSSRADEMAVQLDGVLREIVAG